jgi:hypothetical protein
MTAVPRSRALELVACLLVCMVGTAVVRGHTYDEPLEMDAATYAVVARELRAGRHLYTDLWDHKPPAVHLTFAAAQAIADSGPSHVFLLGLATAWITLLGAYAAAAAIAGHGAGLLAAVFWAIVSADMGLQANQPNTEAFINSALVWAFALLVGAPIARLSTPRAAIVGALFATASLYKHVAVLPALALLMAHIIVGPRSSGERRRAVGQIAVALTVIIAAWSAVVLYFSATGRRADFWSAVVTFNQQYAGSVWANLWEGVVFDRLLPPILFPISPLIVVMLLGLIGNGMNPRSRAMLAAYAVSSACAVALPGHFYAHYYQLWLPVLSIGAAVGVVALNPPRMPASRWLRHAGAAVALLLLAAQLPSLGETPEEWSRRKYGERLVRNAVTARAVNAVLLSGETFFEWGHEPELYYYSGRRPPAGEFRCEHLLHGPRQLERTARLLADLARERPELILVSLAWQFPLDHPVPQWLLANYLEADATTRTQLAARDYRVFIRRGGALAQRLRWDRDATIVQ